MIFQGTIQYITQSIAYSLKKALLQNCFNAKGKSALEINLAAKGITHMHAKNKKMKNKILYSMISKAKENLH